MNARAVVIAPAANNLVLDEDVDALLRKLGTFERRGVVRTFWLDNPREAAVFVAEARRILGPAFMIER